MADRDLVDLIDEWQTGAFLVIGSALAGVVGALVLQSLDLPFSRLLGFFGGALLAFLVVSYVLYGR